MTCLNHRIERLLHDVSVFFFNADVILLHRVDDSQICIKYDDDVTNQTHLKELSINVNEGSIGTRYIMPPLMMKRPPSSRLIDDKNKVLMWLCEAVWARNHGLCL